MNCRKRSRSVLNESSWKEEANYFTWWQATRVSTDNCSSTSVLWVWVGYDSWGCILFLVRLRMKNSIDPSSADHRKLRIHPAADLSPWRPWNATVVQTKRVVNLKVVIKYRALEPMKSLSSSNQNILFGGLRINYGMARAQEEREINRF